MQIQFCTMHWPAWLKLSCLAEERWTLHHYTAAHHTTYTAVHCSKPHHNTTPHHTITTLHCSSTFQHCTGVTLQCSAHSQTVHQHYPASHNSAVKKFCPAASSAKLGAHCAVHQHYPAVKKFCPAAGREYIAAREYTAAARLGGTLQLELRSAALRRSLAHNSQRLNINL